jgi:hypothetical protein
MQWVGHSLPRLARATPAPPLNPLGARLMLPKPVEGKPEEGKPEEEREGDGKPGLLMTLG